MASNKMMKKSTKWSDQLTKEIMAFTASNNRNKEDYICRENKDMEQIQNSISQRIWRIKNPTLRASRNGEPQDAGCHSSLQNKYQNP